MNQAASPHLRRLEAEAIFIMREVVAEFERPVMLYSIGKDSGVMLHIAKKAFFPTKPPFPLLHVDTTWKFREMIVFRDEMARQVGMELLVHVNQDGLNRGNSPVASGSSVHTQVMKTEGLRQALDKWKFDAAFGGARRDEEKSRAKERIFLASFGGARLGPAQSTARTLASLQHKDQTGRVDAGISLVELDRTRRMGLYRRRGYPGRATLSRQGPARRRAQWRADHGR